MEFNDIHKQLITESYTSSLGDDLLYQLFAVNDKLTGYLYEDRKFISELRVLLEDDIDPFDHLESNEKIDDSDCVLSFAKGNSKLSQLGAVYLSLPAGYTCPFAAACKTMAHRKGGKFKDGKTIKDFGDMRCYAASDESRYPNVRNRNWRNFDLLNKYKSSSTDMADLISRSLDYYESENGHISLFRIHESGDFFSQTYFDAWVKVAQDRSDIVFYAYTKSLPYWKKSRDNIPKNFRLIASEGGTEDHMIDKEKFRKAIVVKDKGEAIKRGLNIDVNDFLAAFGEDDFALLLHGVQSKESGNTSQSMKNSAMLKKYAKKLHTPAGKLSKLFKYYTSTGIDIKTTS